ncbi:MAG: hypothetical protein M1818_006828 [Claussenomyces sp. TS43310]|nr:MAG: hypothetical protein M1818_006828 [Claussenomyces sp. TS43310]
MPVPDQSEDCKRCNKRFLNWDALFLHKVHSSEHIACLFCGIDFKTLEGRKRHQNQMHAAQQDLKCAGCGEQFVRAGSYINHIEQHLCPVIQKSDFDHLCTEKELFHKTGRNGLPKICIESQAMMSASENNTREGRSKAGASLLFDEHPNPVPWGAEGEEEKFKHALSKDEANFPSLNNQQDRNESPEVHDLLAVPARLNAKNKAWLDQNTLLSSAPTLVIPSDEPLSAFAVDDAEDMKHPFDPDHPTFNPGEFYNPITRKYNCPWQICRKTFTNTPALIQHLRSPTHMAKKLRCPACLRHFSTATALVQHAESQAKKCRIRETDQYRQAVDQITGGLVDTSGRHEDDTVRYIAPSIAVREHGSVAGKSDAIKHDEYWVQREKDRQALIKFQNENTAW